MKNTGGKIMNVLDELNKYHTQNIKICCYYALSFHSKINRMHKRLNFPYNNVLKVIQNIFFEYLRENKIKNVTILTANNLYRKENKNEWHRVSQFDFFDDILDISFNHFKKIQYINLDDYYLAVKECNKIIIFTNSKDRIPEFAKHLNAEKIFIYSDEEFERRLLNECT